MDEREKKKIVRASRKRYPRGFKVMHIFTQFLIKKSFLILFEV
mgnify:CR=1 FL=1